jgi:hypothetical protein
MSRRRAGRSREDREYGRLVKAPVVQVMLGIGALRPCGESGRAWEPRPLGAPAVRRTRALREVLARVRTCDQACAHPEAGLSFDAQRF